MRKALAILILLSLLLVKPTHLRADVVTVSGRQILVNNSPYLIKGICYNPVPKGSDKRSWSNLSADLALMIEAGINTIRVYSPVTEREVLDEMDAAGIKVIISFGYNQGGNNDILSGSYLDYIEEFKNHNAILFWEFGNEYNYHPEWFNNDITNWYNALNDAAIETHYIDENHPVSTAHGELPDADARLFCSDVDVWGMNIYRWDNPSTLFTEWKAASTKPMYLSEAGADRFMAATMNGYDEGENEEAQADATRNILNAVFKSIDICAGVALFEFTDEWWKAGNPNDHDNGGWAPNSSGVPYDGAPNEEYWGILDIDRNKTMAYEVVKTKYKSIIIGATDDFESKPTFIYPNPATNVLHVDAMGKSCTLTEIFDITGKKYFSLSDNFDSNQSFNIDALQSGLYYIKFVYKDRIEVLRFVKVKY